ncbi:hypothetical protein Tco_1134916 [Tanacetum coccineum]
MKPNRKNTEVPQPNGPTTNVADEAGNEDNVSKHSNDLLLSGEDSMKLEELMELCTNLQQRVIDMETTKTTQGSEIASLKRRVEKLEKKNKSRTYKLKRLYKVGLSRRVKSSDEASLGDQEDAFKQGRKPIDAIDEDDNITLNKEFLITTVHDKGKGKMVEPEPVKKFLKKDQIRLDEELAFKLQVKIEADQLLAKTLQAVEKEELTIEERDKLFQQLLEKRRKFFAAKRAKKKRNRPPTKAQKRKNAKKQKIDDDQETAKMKELMEIVSDEEGIAIDAIPLATKPPSIVDWKILKEEKKS